MEQGLIYIATRTGLHCAPLVHKQLGLVRNHGGVRFSVGPFNTDQDIAMAVEAVARIAAWAPPNRKPKRDVEV